MKTMRLENELIAVDVLPEDLNAAMKNGTCAMLRAGETFTCKVSVELSQITHHEDTKKQR